MPRMLPIIVLLALTACGDDDPSEPLVPADLIGTYEFSPRPTVTCDYGSDGEATIEFEELIVSGVSDTEIDADLTYTFEHTLTGVQAEGVSLITEFDSTDFFMHGQGVVDFAHGNNETGDQLGATGLVAVEGIFTDADEFEGHIVGDIVSDVVINSDAYQVTCEVLDVDVTASR